MYCVFEFLIYAIAFMIGMAYEDLKNKIKIKLDEAWNNRWKNNNRTFLHSIRNTVFDNNPATSFNRQDQLLITRLRIGHTALTHQHLFTKTTRPECEDCKVPITVKHLLNDCKLYKEERKKCKLNNVNIGEMLSKICHCKNVLKFIVDCINLRQLI